MYYCIEQLHFVGYSCNLEDLPTTTSLSVNDMEFSVSNELLIPRSLLTDLINETAKLKGSLVTKDLPSDKLNKLMNVLHWNVRDGSRLIPMMDQVNFLLFYVYRCNNVIYTSLKILR